MADSGGDESKSQDAVTADATAALPCEAAEDARGTLKSGDKLMFEQSAYVEDVDTALSMEVIAKYSKAREGELKVGSDVPDVAVHEYQAPGSVAAEAPKRSLLSFASEGRPLVLTSRHFERVFDAHKHWADFMVVYISEAHPVDEWKLYTDICYEQPKTLADRMDKARLYLDVSKTQVPMSVDTMDNHAETAFSASPERLYIVLDGKVAFKGDQGPDGYDVHAVEAWLTEHVPSL